jgi:hypothetical protein
VLYCFVISRALHSTTLPFPLVLRNQGTVTVEEGYFSAILDGCIHKSALIDTAVASVTPRRCLEYHRTSHKTAVNVPQDA